MTLTRETIRQGVLEVLRDKLHCPAELLAEENWDEPLTGRTFGLTAVDQVMAAMKIPVEEYAKYRKLLLMPQ